MYDDNDAYEQVKLEFSKRMVDHVFAAMQAELIRTPGLKEDELPLHFLACFVGSYAYTRLMNGPSVKKVAKTKKAKQKGYDDALRNFLEVKTGVQDSVAAAFRGAMSTFSGQSADYYCVIKLVPEPLSKMPC